MKAFKDINKLIDFLEIENINQKKILKNSSFPLFIPYRLAKKIKKNDLTDPIFLQFVPLEKENKTLKNFSKDPLKESFFKKGNLLKKYNNRALLITSNYCAMNCRYCFRRFFEKNINNNFDDEIDLIKKDKTINEIILSGGDPLSLSNYKLKDLLLKLNDIKHIKKIRFHSRYIIADPLRIDENFIKILKLIKKQIIFVFHINHINELDIDILNAFKLLSSNNYLLFNQSVLLKNVNDSFEALSKLYELLFEKNVIPYYLHQLDEIQGAMHFKVSIKKGKELIKGLRENVSGYMIPKYVKEKPFEKNKTLIF
ncbi:MAG: L-lysine 2,3-aminomutase [Candidatus Anoxychlamydiales bacterium]|nr:L-lysine 2,3-aminomutase [Candidatus Anoxychlamydiales bacterium]